jgi:hypothetical protein
MFFVFLAGVRLIYGSEDEEVDVDEVWEVDDE